MGEQGPLTTDHRSLFGTVVLTCTASGDPEPDISWINAESDQVA